MFKNKKSCQFISEYRRGILISERNCMLVSFFGKMVNWYGEDARGAKVTLTIRIRYIYTKKTKDMQCNSLRIANFYN